MNLQLRFNPIRLFKVQTNNDYYKSIDQKTVDKIKESAIEFALQKREVSEIAREIGILSARMEEGFKGVHARQDLTNGKVIKNQNDIERLRDGRRYTALVWTLFTMMLTSFIGIIVYLANK